MRKVANQSFTMSTLLRASQATKLTARKAVRRAESVHAGYTTQYYHEAENSDNQVAEHQHTGALSILSS